MLILLKQLMAPIADLVIRLPVNALRVAIHQMSQWGEKGNPSGLGFGVSITIRTIRILFLQ